VKLSHVLAAAIFEGATKLSEFEKGKNAIIVPSKDQLVTTLDTVITAVKAGELDEHLTQYAKARGVPKSKRVA
jgi:hypothetical protein